MAVATGRFYGQGEAKMGSKIAVTCYCERKVDYVDPYLIKIGRTFECGPDCKENSK